MLSVYVFAMCILCICIVRGVSVCVRSIIRVKDQRALCEIFFTRVSTVYLLGLNFFLSKTEAENTVSITCKGSTRITEYFYDFTLILAHFDF